MSENNDLMSKKMFSQFCSVLDELEIKYTPHEDDLHISFTVVGNDVPALYDIEFNTDFQMIRILSKMPFVVPEDKRFDVGKAVTIVNFELANGNFDFCYRDGEILFRISTGYKNSVISKDLMRQLLIVSFMTVERYNDKFLFVAQGIIKPEDLKE